MATTYEEDVVIAFRQRFEEELRRTQQAGFTPEPVLVEGDTPEDNLRRLAGSHAELQREVALLRTIILRLVSEPVDAGDSGGTAAP